MWIRLPTALLVLFSFIALAPACVRGSVSVEEVKELIDEGGKLIDVRTPQEFSGGAIPGAVNIPIGQLADHIKDLPRDVPLIVYCHSGTRSAAAASMLREKGFTQVYDLGAKSRWR